MKTEALLAVGIGLVAFALPAEVKLAAPFGDGMVLQRDRAVPVWGTAAAGKAVKVAFGGAEVAATAGADGRWRADLPAMAASAEGRELKVNGEVRCRDVLVGEVWFASGQSNMECPIWGGGPRYRDGKGAMMTAMTREPQIRFVKMARAWSATPVAAPKVVWRKFLPESFRLDNPTLSAVAFYYALELHNALDIPIGIVDASWGGTNIDAWTPRCGYANHPELKDVADYPVTANWRKSMRRGPVSGACQQPTVLWNAMVSAWTPYATRGFIWYQGCTNNGEADRYCDKMHALYDGWKTALANPDLSLYFVMLAPFRQDWFRLQQSQLKFAQEEPHAALAVIADRGNLADIHPNDKEIVAKRLAVHALKRDYGFAGLEDESPTLKEWKMEGDRIHLTFDHAKSFYIYNDNNSLACGFEVTLPGGKTVRADVANADRKGNLRGAEVVLCAPGLTEAGFLKLTYLRNNPWFGALYGDSSLPVAPFEIDRTDEFASRRTAEAKLGDAEKIPELAGYRKAYVSTSRRVLASRMARSMRLTARPRPGSSPASPISTSLSTRTVRATG